MQFLLLQLLENLHSTSTGQHCNKLFSQMLEALMCSQDWIRSKYKGLFVDHFIFSFSCNSMFYLKKHESKIIFCAGVLADEGRPASFWSYLNEVQEGLQVIVLD